MAPAPRASAADDCRRFVDQFVVLQGRHHEKGIVYAACDVARQDGSPTCRLQTGKPWLSPSSRSLPRTTVQRVSLANIRRQASTWSSISKRRVIRPSQRASFSSRLTMRGTHPDRQGKYASRRKRRGVPRAGTVQHRLGSTGRVVFPPQGTSTVSTPRSPPRPSGSPRSFVAPGKIVMRPLNASSLLDAALPTDTHHLVTSVEGMPHHVPPKFAGRPEDADLQRRHHLLPSSD